MNCQDKADVFTLPLPASYPRPTDRTQEYRRHEDDAVLRVAHAQGDDNDDLLWTHVTSGGEQYEDS